MDAGGTWPAYPARADGPRLRANLSADRRIRRARAVHGGCALPVLARHGGSGGRAGHHPRRRWPTRAYPLINAAARQQQRPGCDLRFVRNAIDARSNRFLCLRSATLICHFPTNRRRASAGLQTAGFPSRLCGPTDGPSQNAVSLRQPNRTCKMLASLPYIASRLLGSARIS
jgi:hypothetical protein